MTSAGATSKGKHRGRTRATTATPAGDPWARRDVLRALGLSAAGLSLGTLPACGSDGAPSGSTRGSTTSTTATAAIAAAQSPRYDPDAAYWNQGNFAPVTTEETITDLTVTGAIPSELSGLFVRNGSTVIHHAGKLLSTGEVGWPFELDPTDLSTVGAWDFAGQLGLTMTAHPKIDPETGRMHFFGYEFLSPKLTYYAVAPDGALDVISPIAVDEATMMHDFAITDRHAVFWVGPVIFDIADLDGSGDGIRWADVPLGFVFHGLNAHAEGDDVLVNLHRLPEAFGPKGEISSHLIEWRIGTGGTDLAFAGERQVSDRPMDLPTIDRRWAGRKNRHGWCATTTTAESDHPGANQRGGEGFFVPVGRGEGEGYVMTYIWDRTTYRSSLGIFDAQATPSGPVAEVQLPVRVPFGFHGLWVDEADL